MTLSSPGSVVPAEHLIVITARRPDVAQGCAEALTRAGYPVVVCREESTGFPVVEAVEKHCPHLLIVDDDIEWADGIHVAQRLHADPVFANLYVLVLLRLGIGIPNWMWGDWSRNSQITKPFNPAELVLFVRRIFELIIAGETPLQCAETQYADDRTTAPRSWSTR